MIILYETLVNNRNVRSEIKMSILDTMPLPCSGVKRQLLVCRRLVCTGCLMNQKPYTYLIFLACQSEHIYTKAFYLQIHYGLNSCGSIEIQRQILSYINKIFLWTSHLCCNDEQQVEIHFCFHLHSTLICCMQHEAVERTSEISKQFKLQ